METTDFNAQAARVFDWMDRHRPTRGYPVGFASRPRRVVAMLVGLHLLHCALIGGGLYLAYRADPQHFGWQIHWFMLAFFALFLPPGVLYPMDFEDKLTQRDRLDRLLGWFEAKWGQGSVLRQEEAQFIAQLAEKNPRVREACIKWAAANPSGLPTYREYRVLRRVNARLAVLLEAARRQREQQAHAEKIRELLNETQMMEEANSLAQQARLSQGTAEVAQPSLTPVKPRL